MTEKIVLKDGAIKYNLERKRVKNINLRIKSDGTVWVSANRWVLKSVINNFVLSKADFIIKAQKKYEKYSDLPKKEYFNEDEIRGVIDALCKEVYPYFKSRDIDYPEIKFRKMVSRWGSCNPKKQILTFNTNLMYAPFECIKYVVLHEFTHFLVANHSMQFYDELKKVCPDYKTHRKKLKEISIR